MKIHKNLLKDIMNKFEILEEIENMKKEIKKSENALLDLTNKNINKNLKKYLNERRKLASFINESD